MYYSKTHCKHCDIEFEIKNEDKDICEKLLIKTYLEHIRSGEHKLIEEEWRLNQCTTYMAQSRCQCGEVIEVKIEDIRVKNITEEFKRDIERELLSELTRHRYTDKCKRIIKRDNKISQILS